MPFGSKNWGPESWHYKYLHVESVSSILKANPSTDKTYISESKHPQLLAEDRVKSRVQESYQHTLRQFTALKSKIYHLPSFAVALDQQWPVGCPGLAAECAVSIELNWRETEVKATRRIQILGCHQLSEAGKIKASTLCPIPFQLHPDINPPECCTKLKQKAIRKGLYFLTPVSSFHTDIQNDKLLLTILEVT